MLLDGIEFDGMEYDVKEYPTKSYKELVIFVTNFNTKKWQTVAEVIPPWFVILSNDFKGEIKPWFEDKLFYLKSTNEEEFNVLKGQLNIDFKPVDLSGQILLEDHHGFIPFIDLSPDYIFYDPNTFDKTFINHISFNAKSVSTLGKSLDNISELQKDESENIFYSIIKYIEYL